MNYQNSSLIVPALGLALLLTAAPAPAASDINSGKNHRIAEAQQETAITGSNGRQTTVKSTTLFLTGPEDRIPETGAETPAPAERKADSLFAGAMATLKENTEVQIPEQTITAYIAALTAADTVALEAILANTPSISAYIWKPKGFAVKVNGLMFLLDSAPADYKRIEAAKMLISKRVDPKFEWNRDMKNAGSRSNLVSYPEHLQIEELEMLLKNGADPNFPVCVPGDPPICRLTNAYLQDKEDKEDVKAKILLMLKYGADPAHRPSMKGRETALEIAQKANATELLKILTTMR